MLPDDNGNLIETLRTGIERYHDAVADPIGTSDYLNGLVAHMHATVVLLDETFSPATKQKLESPYNQDIIKRFTELEESTWNTIAAVQVHDRDGRNKSAIDEVMMRAGCIATILKLVLTRPTLRQAVVPIYHALSTHLILNCDTSDSVPSPTEDHTDYNLKTLINKITDKLQYYVSQYRAVYGTVTISGYRSQGACFELMNQLRELNDNIKSRYCAMKFGMATPADYTNLYTKAETEARALITKLGDTFASTTHDDYSSYHNQELLSKFSKLQRKITATANNYEKGTVIRKHFRSLADTVESVMHVMVNENWPTDLAENSYTSLVTRAFDPECYTLAADQPDLSIRPACEPEPPATRDL